MLSEKLEEVIPAAKQKKADDQEEKCDFASFVLNKYS